MNTFYLTFKDGSSQTVEHSMECSMEEVQKYYGAEDILAVFSVNLS